jgi:rhodanese-related sulfurtransferase
MEYKKNDPKEALRYFSDKMSFTTGPVELNTALGAENIVIVDVRAAKDYEEAHIPGSVNLPKDRWSTYAGLSRDKLNVLVCYSHVCHLAATAAVEFARAGYSVMELEGGFKSWKEHKLQTESGAAQEKKSTNGGEPQGRTARA